jgi:hypothetical protein
MSLIRTWTVNCDLHLARTCVGWVGQEDTANEARAEAERAGWRKAAVDGVMRDVCPRCYSTALGPNYQPKGKTS